MSNYLAFIHGGIESGHTGSPNSAVQDGINLARQCVEKLEDLRRGDFPPKLLILLATPGYLEGRRAAQLLEGINSTFVDASYHDTKLIGSSVAAVFFKGSVHKRGALLVCLASRLLEVEIASSPCDAGPPERPVRELLQQLELDSEAGEDPNPFANRVLFTFMPGNNGRSYLAADLHECLRERVWARVPIVGGVSSGFDGRSYLPAAQFANRQVYKNFLVAARVTSGTLVGMSAKVGLEPTARIVQLTGLAADGHTVNEFNHRPAPEVIEELRREFGFVVLGKSTYNEDPFVEYPGDRERVRLLKRAREGDVFTVLKVVPDKLTDRIGETIEQSCRSVGMLNPVGCLGFRCSSYIAKGQDIGLDLRAEIVRVEEKLRIPDGYVGGFVDGEAGRDRQGRSLLRSWSTAAFVFGDELRPRTAVSKGFYNVAEFLSSHPSPTESPEHSVHELLDLIYRFGFPGVRLLLLLEDIAGQSLVVPDANYTNGSLNPASGDGLPFQLKLPNSDTVPEEHVALVVRTGRFKFVPCDDSSDAATGHYYTPLRNTKHEITAVLHIDVGKKTELRAVEEKLLKHLGMLVGASLSRVFSSQETAIRAKLQESLKRHLSAAETEEGVRGYLNDAVRALGLDLGRIWRANLGEYRLELYVGCGDYHEAAPGGSPSINFNDTSPTMQAYGSRRGSIVNDARNGDHHLRKIERGRNAPSAEREVRGGLEWIGSQADIYFESGHDIKGTVSLASARPWFFRRAHTRVLRKIAEHVEFLFDHLEQKSAVNRASQEATQAREEAEKAREQAEAARARQEQTNNQLSFMLGVSPQLAQQNLDDFGGTLKEILLRFCKWTRAQIGSLYLWNQERRLYVLRAERGWRNGNWVNSAAYNKDDGWFGARLRGEPRYIPDLQKYYKDEGYYSSAEAGARPGGLYAKYMFDKALSDTFTVEVIGLPLRIGQDAEIGVLALYRQVKPGGESGFLKTVVDAIKNLPDRLLISGAANEVAGLIGALLQRHEDRAERTGRERRRRISDALSKHIERESEDADASFGELLCNSVVGECGASGAELYAVVSRQGAGGLKVVPKASHPRQQKRRPGPVVPDPHLSAVLDDYADKIAGERMRADDIYIKRKGLTPQELNDPSQAATEGLVERVCLPLISGKELIEVLDLRWEVAAGRPHDEEAHFRKKYLWQLSEELSMFSRLHQQTVQRIKAEKGRQMFMGKVGAVAQGAHTMRRRLRQLFDEANESRKKKEHDPDFENLMGNLRTFEGEFDQLVKLASDTDLLPRPIPLLSLIDVENRGDGEKVIVSKRLEGKQEIKCHVSVPPEVTIKVTAGLMRFAFENIIDNAITATEEITDGNLYISTAPGPTPALVQVTFINNGRTIEADKCDAINNDDFDGLGHKKWGMMIAKGFTVWNGGNMIVRGLPEGGTAIIFTLPVAEALPAAQSKGERQDEDENSRGRGRAGGVRRPRLDTQGHPAKAHVGMEDR